MQPKEVGKSFTPASVEKSGLGPAFFAVVAAVIILLLLSIFGNNYLTGAYHLVGSRDTLYATNITFNTETDAFAVYVDDPIYPRFGLFQMDPALMLKVRLTNASYSPYLGLQFNFRHITERDVVYVTTDTAYVVIANLTRSNNSLLPGAVVYFNGTNYVLAQHGFAVRDRGLWYFQDVYLPLYFVNASGVSSDCPYKSMHVKLAQGSRSVVPESAIAVLEEDNLRGSGPWWFVHYKPRGRAASLNGVFYQRLVRPGAVFRVEPGFVSEYGSSFASRSRGDVTLKYVYNASAHLCPGIPPG